MAAGAGTLLAAGCGAPEEPPPDAELLGRLLAEEGLLVEAYGRVDDRFGRALQARARSLEERLRGAGAQPVGGDAIDAGRPLEEALTLERRQMVAALEAVAGLRDDGRRELAATVLTAAAQHESLLLTRLGRDPLATAFPDGRAG